MNLLNNKKVFITESVWISLLDETHEKHESAKRGLKYLLDGKYYLITSSYVIDSVLETLKGKSVEKAKRFLEIIDRSVLGNYLRVFWLSRRIRRRALDMFTESDSKHLSHTLNLLLIEQKNISMIYTHHEELYATHNIHCIHPG